MPVTLSGGSGLTNAKTSLLSPAGSFEISGASRCEDISALLSVEVAGQGAGQGAVADDDLALPAHQPDLPAVEVPDVGDDGRAAGAGRGRVPAGGGDGSCGGGARGDERAGSHSSGAGH